MPTTASDITEVAFAIPLRFCPYLLLIKFMMVVMGLMYMNLCQHLTMSLFVKTHN